MLPCWLPCREDLPSIGYCWRWLCFKCSICCHVQGWIRFAFKCNICLFCRFVLPYFCQIIDANSLVVIVLVELLIIVIGWGGVRLINIIACINFTYLYFSLSRPCLSHLTWLPVVLSPILALLLIVRALPVALLLITILLAELELAVHDELRFQYQICHDPTHAASFAVRQ